LDGIYEDEFRWGKVKGAISFGLVALVMGIPTVPVLSVWLLLMNMTIGQETVSLVVFGIIGDHPFAWIFGWTRAGRNQPGARHSDPAI